MKSSAKLMKAVGIIYIIHGIIMGLLSIYLLSMAAPYLNMMGGLMLLLIFGGFTFLYIYIGYELFSLRNSTKMRNLLIASVILSCIEIIAAMVKGEVAGVFFIAELILSIVALCNIDSYKKFKGEKNSPKKTAIDSKSKSTIDAEEYSDDEL